MQHNEILLIVCESLTTMGKDVTVHGVIDIHDHDILDITLDELNFDYSDRSELAIEIERTLECEHIYKDTYEEWETICDVVEYVKTI